MLSPRPVDRIEITFLVDNATDSLSSTPPFVTREWVRLQRVGMKRVAGAALCCANHGLSLVITVEADGERRIVLFDGGPVDYIATDNRQRQHQFRQEIQLVGTSADDRLKWVVGGFYFDEYGRDTNNVILASGFFNAFEGLPGPIDGSPAEAPTAPGGTGNPINIALDLDFDVFNKIRIKSYAAFGQATYALATT